jgi:hypothetical protein
MDWGQGQGMAVNIAHCHPVLIFDLRMNALEKFGETGAALRRTCMWLGLPVSNAVDTQTRKF